MNDDKFNYEMETNYNTDFKAKLSYERLYNILGNEFQFDVREYFERCDQRSPNSGVFHKLKNYFGFDVKSYANESDADKYNVLKLMNYLIHTQYSVNSDGTIDKGKSIIDIMKSPSLKSIGKVNSVYGEYFKSCIDGIKTGVTNPEHREKEIERICNQWKIISSFLRHLALLSTSQVSYNLSIVVFGLDKLNKSVVKYDCERENVIDSFYNIILSTQALSEIEDDQSYESIIYQSSDFTKISPEIIELGSNLMFSQNIEWNEFIKILDRKEFDWNDSMVRNVWALILFNIGVTEADVKNIKTSSYNFMLRYAKEVSECWICYIGKEQLTIFEWIVVVQELLLIKNENPGFEDSFFGAKGNIHLSLQRIIKNLNSESDRSKWIIINRLKSRAFMLIGYKYDLTQVVRIDDLIKQLVRHVFSYHELEAIIATHKTLYLWVLACLTSSNDDDYRITLLLMNSKLSLLNVQIAEKDDFYGRMLICLLSYDQTQRLINDDEFMKIRSVGLSHLYKGEIGLASDLYHGFSQPVTAIDTLISKLNDMMRKYFESPEEEKLRFFDSCVVTSDITLGEELNYRCTIDICYDDEKRLINLQMIKFE